MKQLNEPVVTRKDLGRPRRGNGQRVCIRVSTRVGLFDFKGAAMDRKVLKNATLILRLSKADRQKLEKLAVAKGSDLSKVARDLLAHGLSERTRELERMR
jgi:hypothetical protein